MNKKFILLFSVLIVAIVSNAQQASISGVVKDSSTGKKIAYALILLNNKHHFTTDSLGNFSFKIKQGTYNLSIKATGYNNFSFIWNIDAANVSKEFNLHSQANQLSDVKVKSERNWDVSLQKQTIGTSIYAGKKNEIIEMGKLSANTAINNARQIYAKVPGINIIENDEAGVQLSIATRGLNPNRTTEFNSRQNGYDIAADPIGYPETYYSPPTDALESIEIIRGAASLQYGTQFGGLLNFHFKDAPSDKNFEIVSKQTAGSYGFFNSFNSIGGNAGKWSYYGFYNYKRSDGWRQNTGFDVHNAYTSVHYRLSPKITLGLQYTFMHYDMQQPGGLTDTMFYQNPRQSVRNRNWFTATWNIPVLTMDYNIDTNNLLSVKAYALIADRKNVGDINSIIFQDNPTDPRTVMSDDYRNYYMEARYIHHYYLIKNLKSSFLTGVRFYHGNTHRIQGLNYTGSDANFSIRDMNNLQIDYRFPSYNVAAFAENVFQITDKFSITPGARFEYIQTNGDGYTLDTTVSLNKVYANQRHTRKFPLFGIGLDYQVSKFTDAYANFSQNYSPINFGDIVVLQPGMKVDTALKDVKGYNADIGYRGQIGNLFSFDVSGYFLMYKNRIGTMLETDGDANIYQYETNISNSRSLGTELFGEINLLHLLPQYKHSQDKIALFSSVAYTSAKYIDAPPNRKQFEGKTVEYAPKWIERTGLDYAIKNFSGDLEYSYTSYEYADATNALSSADGATGLIPAYHTIDFTISYLYRKWLLSFSANNLTNEKYFTRRTTGFPGPGIIPSEGRSFYLTLQFKL